MALTIHHLASDLKAKSNVQAAARSRNAENLTRFINAQNKAATQLALIMALQDLVDHEPSGLAHEIVMGQIEKLHRFGQDRLFPMSERQIAAIVRDLVK